MLYQSYKNKLDKRNKIILRLWKLRFIICAVLLLGVAATTLMCITGNVFAENFKTEIYYGESLEPSAKALFKPVSYEYRAAGQEEWQSEAPRLAGEYEVRAYSNDISGSKRCGKVHSYKILPVAAEVVIVEDAIDYGAEPHCTAELKYGDTMCVNGFEYEPIEDGNFYISARAGSVKILSAGEGKDVTSSYAVNTVKKAVINNPREITVKTGSANFIYDGRPHTHGEWEITSALKLLEGHSAEVIFPSLTAVGKTENRPQIKIMCVDGDVTRYYNITEDFGELSVEPRPITVKTGSASFIYDGGAHTHGELEITSALKLPEGHSAETAFPSVTEVGRAENRPQIKIMCADGDVTRYYNITEDFGELSVEPRPITVKTGSANFVYDGGPHFEESAQVVLGNLVDGHGMDVEYPAVLDAGNYKNEPLSFKIKDGSGEDKTSSYSLTFEAGDICILRKTIKVSTPSNSWTYNGEEHFNCDYSVGEVLEGHTFLGKVISFAKITNAGSVLNSVVLETTVLNGDKDVTGNYALDYEYGTLNVVPRKFKVRTGNGSWVYDKKPHTCLDFELVDSGEGEGLLQGAVAVPHSAGVSNITDTAEIGYAQNILGFTVTENGRDVTKNYTVYGEWGKLRIKSPVEITVFGKSKQYDGSPLELGKTDYAVTKVPPDVKAEWVSAEIEGKLNTVGELSLAEVAKSSTAALTDGEGNDRTAGGENRIDFICETAPLKILPRAIEITSVSIAKTADGEILSGNIGEKSAWISLGSLLNGHRIETEVTGTLSPNENSAQNTISAVRILDEKGVDVSLFYSIKLRPGLLEWIPD